MGGYGPAPHGLKQEGWGVVSLDHDFHGGFEPRAAAAAGGGNVRSLTTAGFMLAVFLVLALATPASVAAAGGAASIIEARGSGSVVAANGVSRPVEVGGELEVGEIVTVDPGGFARIRFNDGAELAVREDSRIRVEQFSYKEAEPEEDRLVFSLIKGGLRAVSGSVGRRGSPEAFEGRSLTGSIGIRGTRFGMFFCESGECDAVLNELPPGVLTRAGDAGLYFEVTEGSIVFRNDAGEFPVETGQWGYSADRGQPPVIENEPSCPLTPILPLGLEDDPNEVCARAGALQPEAAGFAAQQRGALIGLGLGLGAVGLAAESGGSGQSSGNAPEGAPPDSPGDTPANPPLGPPSAGPPAAGPPAADPPPVSP
jgi:hypothetical protein